MSDKFIVFDHAAVLDVINGELLPNRRITIRGSRIERVEPAQGAAPLPADGRTFDLKGKTVMPGLCDAHVHVTAWTPDDILLMRSSPAYTTARAAEILEDMLMRGFTTVRDGGGADYGLAQSVQEGYIKGPRILYCGHALSQTGGHADLRARGEQVVTGSSNSLSLGHLCDGVPEMRRACRDEIRKGAHHIKLMLSGGITSPTDRIANAQFSEDEIRAAVEEAEMAGLYCMAHVYTARAVNRALKCGVRSLEHCNLIDESSAELFLKHGAFMVPTLATFDALVREGVEAGLPQERSAKLHEVADRGLNALALAYKRGVKLVYGTDLLGRMHKNQLNGFRLCAKVQSPIDLIRSATCTAAELFNEAGQTGVVAAGARADLLVVDGNPLTDLGCLLSPGRYLSAIMKDGVFQKDAL
ncbi:MAG: amidohydrolase family protein [Kiritimatiellae bacterium]|nr:amidohydrolase family protein [Kiritimatiellia bacterium]